MFNKKYKNLTYQEKMTLRIVEPTFFNVSTHDDTIYNGLKHNDAGVMQLLPAHREKSFLVVKEEFTAEMRRVLNLVKQATYYAETEEANLVTKELIYQAGKQCIINACRDLYMDIEARPFINSACTIVKITKQGLVQVALNEDTRKKMSFSMSNIDFKRSRSTERRK